MQAIRPLTLAPHFGHQGASTSQKPRTRAEKVTRVIANLAIGGPVAYVYAKGLWAIWRQLRTGKATPNSGKGSS